MTTKNEKRHRNDKKKTFTRIRKKRKKQKSNFNKRVVDDLMIHLILIVRHNIVLYQNQQSLFIRRFIKIHKNFDDL